MMIFSSTGTARGGHGNNTTSMGLLLHSIIVVSQLITLLPNSAATVGCQDATTHDLVTGDSHYYNTPMYQ
jgi:hypothetical protein